MGPFGGGKNGKPIALPCKSGMLNPSDGVASQEGLSRVDQAVDAWTRALSVLSVDGLAPAEEE